MAKTKAQLMAEKMAAQRIAQKAFEAGAKPIVVTDPPKEEPAAEEATETTPEVTEAEKEVQKATEPAQNATKEEKATKDTPKPKKPATAKKAAKEDKPDAAPVKLLDKIAKKKREEKKSNAYYLSVKNMEELAKRAEKADMSASELLDSILTAVFSE